jgi:hypothetical protein
VLDNVKEDALNLVLGERDAIMGPENNIAIRDHTERRVGHWVSAIWWF